MDWTDEIRVRCCLNRDYLDALAELQKLEPDFRALREQLDAPHRELLDRYIAACEALDDAVVNLAYQIGIENHNYPLS